MDGATATMTGTPASPTNGQAAPAQQAPPVNPTFQQPPVGTAERPAPQVVSIPLDVWQETSSYKAKWADAENQKAAALEIEQQKAVLALAQKGEVEKALEEQRRITGLKEQEWNTRHNGVVQSWHAEKVTAELAVATSGANFASPEAARMFRASVQELLTVEDNPDGTKAVVSKVGRRPAAEVIRERLSDPSLAFFFAASPRGGSGTDGTRTPANAQQQGPPSLLDEMVARQNSDPVMFSGIGLGPKPY